MISSKATRDPSICLLFLAVGILAWSCSQRIDKEGFVTIDTGTEPEALPYFFVSAGGASGSAYPIILDTSGKPAVYEVQDGRGARRTLSSIVFGFYPSEGGKRLEQANRETEMFWSHHPFDYDNDLIEELAITYVTGDSLWVEILDAFDGSLYRKRLVVGEDRDGNGYWDGRGFVWTVSDLNDDGYVELLAVCETGFDFYPRKLMCVDWFNDEILWDFHTAGHIGHRTIRVIHSSASEQLLVVFGVSAPSNGVTMSGMDDSHSYLICLNKDGSLRWKKVTGGSFTSTRPVVIDYYGDGIADILADHSVKTNDGQVITRLIVYDTDGAMLDSVTLPCQMRRIALFDIDSGGQDEVLICLEDNTLQVFSQNLELIRKYKNARIGNLYTCNDFIGVGKNQLLAGMLNGAVRLFSSDFKPLACLVDGGWAEVMQTDTTQFTYIVSREERSQFYQLEKTPWFTVFSRHPILAFFAGSVPLGVITAVIWFVLVNFRRKNRIIADQRDKLDNALAELREAQEQLIAAEKYKQAKDIAGGVAHEIHNALCPAINSLDKLRQLLEVKGTVESERNMELLELCEDAVSRGIKMTELVTAYSRLETEKADQQVGLREVLEEIVQDNKPRLKELGVTPELKLEDDYLLRCNRIHAYSLFNNLMLNALDALAGVDRRAITISAEKTTEYLRIEFTDTGVGISPEAVSKVFDIFYSSKPSSGTGIGLAMVKKIVELYDGHIEVESFLDKGTKFTILLPVV